MQILGFLMVAVVVSILFSLCCLAYGFFESAAVFLIATMLGAVLIFGINLMAVGHL